MHRFWNFEETDTDRILYLDGYIAPESWFEDEISPKEFKNELEAGIGNITVWVNSPGGDFFAASQIYTMLKEYSGQVLVKIDGIAASAAAVIAMAGDRVLMSPTAMLMIHNPSTFVWGEESDMQKGIEMLSEVKEAIINAFEAKTGLPRKQIAQMMDAETWFSANKAVDLGFADEILYSEPPPQVTDFMFDRVTVVNALMRKLPAVKAQSKPVINEPLNSSGVSYEQLIKRLELIKGR
ncbi:head maturation protease, ClpP-related [Desulfoscipio gibsoniae]|uniref:ATP-dependent Clp protease proteolytic subunit n=1 Tax=Desulfoscipio gibsoniae DSM 7213 TaxID=767817 RepID=R4KLU0_9FIRM|nr:head maturation protease, ClpP-related [Desulfoscipio gibsoniae]AGL03649.1 protease subunit of ATP-dependent protease [Desulfoscipio gibsoniae DSM 7213]